MSSKLKTLYISNNKISDMEEINTLQCLPDLKDVLSKETPFKQTEKI
eukprot:UN06872